MSVDSVLARIAQIQEGLQPRKPPVPSSVSGAGFQAVLGQATKGAPGAWSLAGAGAPAGQTAGLRALAYAQQEVGVAEQPPGSNDAPRIAEYRSSTAGSGIGPWCGYFVSWAAKMAGAPLGEAGQGFGAVSAAWDWAQRTGRAIPPTQPPQAGDLIVWDGTHIGIVESVDPDGKIHTIEGNSSNAVTRRTHSANGDGATGWIRI